MILCFMLVQLPGAVLHLPEAHTTPYNELHRDPEVVTRYPRVPQQVPTETQGLC